MTDELPPGVRGDEPGEHYGDVLAARERAQVSQSLGDDSALDALAMRDHVIGLEAELTNARAEAEHWRSVAAALRAELGQKWTVRLLRAARFARRGYAAYRRRSSAR